MIEFVIAMTLSAVIFTEVAFSLKPLIDFWLQQTFYQGPGLEEKLALDRTLREIREIKDPQSVLTAGASTFSFRNASNQVVTYSATGGSLFRNSDLMVEEVTALTFDYWDKDNQSLSSPLVSPDETNLRQIRMTLSVQSGGISRTARSLVTPRNLS